MIKKMGFSRNWDLNQITEVGKEILWDENFKLVLD